MGELYFGKASYIGLYQTARNRDTSGLPEAIGYMEKWGKMGNSFSCQKARFDVELESWLWYDNSLIRPHWDMDDCSRQL